MKKLLSLLLALAMMLSLVACGGNDAPAGEPADEPAAGDTVEEPPSEDEPADEPAAGDTVEETPSEDEPTAEDAPTVNTDIKVAMVTDSGDITDQSFNQTTYEAAKTFCEANGIEFNYYKPDSDSDEARIAKVDAAVADGHNVIILPGFLFAATLVEVTGLYPDVKFIALDIAAGNILAAALGADYDDNPDNWDVTEYYNADNTYIAIYQEEISGYMAGQAAVKMGYKHLGFLGGMAVPAVMRFGYGFVQGANDAAKELGIADEVAVEYIYGGLFYGDPDFTAYMDNWYQTLGVEAVFACGGGIYASAAEAAAKVDGKVIGVDSDQSHIINTYGEGMTLTSAMKGLGPTVTNILTEIVAGNWDNYVGMIDNLGLVSGDDPALNYVQLPMDATQWSDSFSQEDYVELVGKLYSGEITVSNSTTELPALDITLNEYGSIK